MTEPTIAKTVVFRHPCDCPTASRPLGAGEHAEHRFDVDGEPFPWRIAEPGPRFVRHGDAVMVTVDIFPMDPDSYEWLSFSHTYGEVGEIGGRPFPWVIVGEVIYRHHFDDIPKLTLTFVADEVDADVDIPRDESPEWLRTADSAELRPLG